MDQHDRTPGATGTGGSANTPAFGSDTSAMHTAADHQIPDQTAPAHGASTGATRSGSGGTATAASTQQAGGMMDRAEETLTQGMRQAGERVDSLAQQLDDVAQQRLSGTEGPKARLGQAAHSVADTMESVANYLRNNDAQALRGDLEQQMREHPLQTLMVAVAAGWVVGKVLR